MKIIDFGLGDYAEILRLQQTLFEKLITGKREGKSEEEKILVGEHPPVITLGRKAKEKNVLISENRLSQIGIPLFHVGRGGDVTYHCPGQLIIYPIIDLERHGLGVKDYVNVLEESVINLLSKYGIKGERVEGATGVWIDKGKTSERKICAIGIKCSRFCAMHGLALNVNSDLSGFSLINPCGFQDKGVTSMQKEIEKELDLKKIKEDFLHIFLSLIFPFEESLHLFK